MRRTDGDSWGVGRTSPTRTRRPEGSRDGRHFLRNGPLLATRALMLTVRSSPNAKARARASGQYQPERGKIRTKRQEMPANSPRDGLEGVQPTPSETSAR